MAENVKVRVLSDLHLDLIPKHKVTQFIESLFTHDNEDYQNQILVLAGDIGNPISDEATFRHLLHWTNKSHEKTFIITGNHEYYSNRRVDIWDVEKKIRSIVSSFPRVSFLQMEKEEHKGYIFAGCTLWTPKYPDLSGMMNDGRMVKDLGSLQDAIHNSHKKWLGEIVFDPERTLPLVIITHHMPSMSMIHPQYKGYGNMNRLFANELDFLLLAHDLPLWICGHSHASVDVNIGECRCILNPVGYMSEETGWDRNKVVELGK